MGATFAVFTPGHPRLWLFVATALVVGTGDAFFQPALAGLPVQLAPRDRLGDANALLAGALFNLLTWGPYLVLGPVLARDYLGGASAWGAILACYGGGAVLGGLLALGRRPRRPLLAGTVANFGYALPPLALALRLPAVAVAAGALLAGLGSALGSALWATVTQQRVSAQALSRVGAFTMVGAFVFGPIALAAAGPVAAAVGAHAVLGFGAGWAAFGTLVVLAVPAVRGVTWLDPDP